MRLSFSFVLLLIFHPFLVAQNGSWKIEPNLTIPNSKTPWAREEYKGQVQLVPIHHSNVEINNHNGANLAGALTQSFFYKPKMTVEVKGLHARNILHSNKPVIYLHVDTEDDPTPEDKDAQLNYTWVLVRASFTKDRRVFSQVRFTQLTGKAARQSDSISVKVEVLADGWVKMTPEQPLEPDEYAIMPAFKSERFFPNQVFDFRLDPNGMNASDAVSVN